jgi:ribosome biogenesis GTPase
LVVSTSGRHCSVQAPDGALRLCHPRGKKLEAVVGDRVIWRATEDEGVIERVSPRRNQLYRQDETRIKSFAANLDQVLIVLAAEPAFSERFLVRALIACEAAGIRALIALNKADLAQPFAGAWHQLAPYRTMGYATFALALKPHVSDPGGTDFVALERTLQGAATLILGPSGVGKSTLVNRLVPTAAATTGALSRGLKTGTQTTTRTHWYWLGDDKAGALIDSPGFQEFGLYHVAASGLAALMPDFRPYLGQCRFYNCTHTHEPGCAVMAAVDGATGTASIGPSRYRIYADLYAELS